MKKRKAHYNLEEIKAAFADPDTVENLTLSARNGARELRLSDENIVAVIQSLQISGNESQTSPRQATGKSQTRRKKIETKKAKSHMEKERAP